MDPLVVWNGVIVGPLIQGLLLLTGLTGNSGLAIILFTFLVRSLMLPLTFQQIRSQKAMAAVQPLVGELQKRYANDRAKLGAETMRLYKEHGVNPVAGCLPMLLQMPIWIGLYSALFTLSNDRPEFQTPFLWLPNLGKPEEAPWVLPIMAAATQFVIQKMLTMPSQDPQQQMMNRMMQFMPLMFLFFSLQVPAGLVLYWVAGNIFMFFQQYFMVGWGSLWPSGPHPFRPAQNLVSPSMTALTRPSALEASTDGRTPRKGRGKGGSRQAKERRSRGKH